MRPFRESGSVSLDIGAVINDKSVASGALGRMVESVDDNNGPGAIFQIMFLTTSVNMVAGIIDKSGRQSQFIAC